MARGLIDAIKDELSALQLFPFFCLDFTDGTTNYKYTTLDAPTTILGSELITDAGDRNFSAGQGNWVVLSGSDITWDNVDMDFNCAEWNAVRIAAVLTEGELYRLQFDITAYTSGNLTCYFGGDTAIGIVGEAVGTFIVYGTAEASDWIRFGCTAFVGSIDNVSVKKSDQYQSRGFEFESINYTLSNVMDDCTFRIDNLDSTLTAIFVDGTVEETEASVYIGLLDSDGAIVGTALMFTGEVDAFELDETEVRMVIGSMFTRWSNQAYNKHSASCRWKVFKGTECAYAGGGTWCDRSYARCNALANTANFGGFRYLPSIENKIIWWGPNPSQRQDEG